MGIIKYRTAIRAWCKKTPVVSIGSIRKIVGENSTYAPLLLHAMVKRGELYRITKGYYSVYDDPVLAVFCFKPSYLGLQEALSIHNLWEQETNVIILTTKTVREGKRNIFGSTVFLKRLPRTLFFGIEYKMYGDFYVPVSDLEKTFIDMVYFQQPMDIALLKEFRRRMDKKKLRQYLAQCGKGLRKLVVEMASSR